MLSSSTHDYDLVLMVIIMIKIIALTCRRLPVQLPMCASGRPAVWARRGFRSLHAVRHLAIADARVT